MSAQLVEAGIVGLSGSYFGSGVAHARLNMLDTDSTHTLLLARLTRMCEGVRTTGYPQAPAASLEGTAGSGPHAFLI